MNVQYTVNSEAEFFDVIGTKVLGVFLLAVHSHLHRVHIFTRDETGLVCLPTQLERTLQLYW
jgi:hypothetical protein